MRRAVIAAELACQRRTRHCGYRRYRPRRRETLRAGWRSGNRDDARPAFAMVSIRPGSHNFSAGAGRLGEGSGTVPVDVQPGQTIYLQVGGVTSRLSGVGGAAPGLASRVEPRRRRLRPGGDLARSAIECGVPDQAIHSRLLSRTIRFRVACARAQAL